MNDETDIWLEALSGRSAGDRRAPAREAQALRAALWRRLVQRVPTPAARDPLWESSLLERARREGLAGSADASGDHVCRGTLLSREQYLADLAHGWRDARLAPRGGMSRDAIDTWTEAIAKRR